jgi:hypothetical protein
VTSDERVVLRTALIAGVVAFVIGFIGPALLSRSNLGPLFGVFFSGPIGFIGGAVFAMIHLRQSPRLLAIIWAATFLYSLLLIAISASFALIAIGLQTAVGTATMLVDRPRITTFAMIFLLAAATAFPPVRGDSSFAFYRDDRLASSRHAPTLRIRKTTLGLEWALLLAAAAIVARRNK